jgi:hypothetical protein
MNAPDTNGNDLNYESGTIANVSGNQVTLDRPLTGGTDRFEKGELTIATLGTFGILSNSHTPFGAEVVHLSSSPASLAVGKSFTARDDDGKFYGDLGLVEPLPMLHSRLSKILGPVAQEFSMVYIDLVSLNDPSNDRNPNKVIPFEKHGILDTFSTSLDDFRDIAGETEQFWHQLVVFCFQNKEQNDYDPDLGTAEVGQTYSYPRVGFVGKQKVSAIFMETIRDWDFENFTSSGMQNLTPAKRLSLRRQYWDRVAGVVAHEIGHGPLAVEDDPDSVEGVGDHGEGGIMIRGSAVPSTNKFEPSTMLRFRSAKRWGEDR